ncbi:MAG: peroxidase family protein, partial [Polyangiales bacterium]
AVLGKPRTQLSHDLKALIADMMLGYLRMQMNRDTLQDPYPGDLAGHAPPGQRRPEWTRYLPTADGSWRTDDPNMGKAGTRFPHQGMLDASQVAENRALDPSLPNPRLVSRELLAPNGPRKEAPFLNLLAAGWIQFQVHGWFNHRQLPPQEGVLRYPLDEDDPIRLATGQTHLELRKTQPDVLKDRGPQYFQNETSHWWDASQIYGSDQATEDRLRTGPDGQRLPDGKLYVTEDGFLPIDPQLGVEDTGFNRNWWVGVSLFHLLFVLEHNHVCGLLKSEHPTWSSDHVFKAARLEIAAKMARIHTVEWTPAILPNRVLATGLNTNWHGIIQTKFLPFEKRRAGAWWTPKDAVLGGIIGAQTNTYGKPRLFSENFSEVYRLHAAVPDSLRVRTASGATGEDIPIEQARERAAHEVLERLGLEALALTFGYQHMPMLVENNYPAFMLDMSTDGQAKLDLAAVDIARARERGVPGYNQFRAQLGRQRCRDYSDITQDPAKIAKLERVYGPGGIEKVDLQVGLLFEDGFQRPFQGFDDTRFAVFLQEASRRLEADPFFTEKWNDPRVYTHAMRERISNTTLASLLLRHVPGLASSGLSGVNNAFEPWGTTAESAPFEHPLSANEEWFARRPWKKRQRR